jgi:hypothetical protein
MTQTVIGALLEKHDIAEGIPALTAEIAELDAEITALDEQLENADLSEDDRSALEEAKASSTEKRNRRLQKKLLKKDPSYKKAIRAMEKIRARGDADKYSIQMDDESGKWGVAKKDLKLAKRARQAAKGRAK